MAASDSRLVLSKRDVQNPVQIVLDAPMAAHDAESTGWLLWAQRGVGA
jgi:hypothetical protein